MNYVGQYFDESIEILRRIDQGSVERIVELLCKLRSRGGAAVSTWCRRRSRSRVHAVCDFRKIMQIEAYSPSDNVSEPTARINDDGWESCYTNWLRGSRLNDADMLFVFSVGGRDASRNISANLVRALDYARSLGTTICGVVGRDGGYTAQVANACVLVPVVNPSAVTAHTESFQALIWHLIVSHPKMRVAEMKWESTQPATGANS